MTFWIIIALTAAVVSVLLAITLIRGRNSGENPAAYDLRVYRDQLKEVEKDLARGVISEEDGQRAKAEISRRVLTADAALAVGDNDTLQPRGAALVMAAITAISLIGGALWLYNTLGAPGYSDLALKDRIAASTEAHKNRLSQDAVESQLPPRPVLEQPNAEFLDLMNRLRTAVATRPNDLQGHQLLASNEMTMGNYKAAYAAQKQVLKIKGDAVTARDYAEYANMLILAAGGYVSPEAETALRAALARDSEDGASLYYMGLMFFQNDRPDATFRMWRDLLERGPADALWIAPIRAQIVDMSIRAGVEYELPAASRTPNGGDLGGEALTGPSAEDVANAAEMDTQDRQQMIRGMVEQLSTRLADEGGSPAEWARLIGALGVLGEVDRATAIWGEAKTVFAGNSDALATIRSAALRAGLAE